MDNQTEKTTSTEIQEKNTSAVIRQEEVEQVLEKLRFNLQADGGDIQIVSITEDNIVHVRFLGACSCCPGALMTLKFYIERALKEKIPQIKEVMMA